jgi:hypothetical protein
VREREHQARLGRNAGDVEPRLHAAAVIEARVLTRCPIASATAAHRMGDANKPGHELDSFLEGRPSTARATSTSPTFPSAASSASRPRSSGRSSPNTTAGRTASRSTGRLAVDRGLSARICPRRRRPRGTGTTVPILAHRNSESFKG